MRATVDLLGAGILLALSAAAALGVGSPTERPRDPAEGLQQLDLLYLDQPAPLADVGAIVLAEASLVMRYAQLDTELHYVLHLLHGMAFDLGTWVAAELVHRRTRTPAQAREVVLGALFGVGTCTPRSPTSSSSSPVRCTSAPPIPQTVEEVRALGDGGLWCPLLVPDDA